MEDRHNFCNRQITVSKQWFDLLLQNLVWGYTLAILTLSAV